VVSQEIVKAVYKDDDAIAFWDGLADCQDIR
jgi:hypothetical protein